VAKVVKDSGGRDNLGSTMSNLFEICYVFYIAFFLLFIYAYMITNPENSKLSALLQISLPSYTQRLSKKIFRTKVHDFSEASDVLVVLFFIITLGSWFVVFWFLYPMILASSHVSSRHCVSGAIVCFFGYFTWYIAYCIHPGSINTQSLPKYDNYPYDNVLFVPNTICPTLNIRKLARSKYEQITCQHIPRFDHYCGWLKNPIGEDNYRYYILFLVVHAAMCWYGTFVILWIFRGIIRDLDLFNAKFISVNTGEAITVTSWIIFQYLLLRHFSVASLLFLLLVMTCLLSAYNIFHFYLIVRNMTTNEFCKWRSVIRWRKEVIKYYQNAGKKDTFQVSTCKEKNVSWNFSYGKFHWFVITRSTENGDEDHQHTQEDNQHVSHATSTATVSNKDSKRGIIIIKDGKEIVLHPGPLPHNIYNLGIVENVKEFLFPRSLRHEALSKWRQNKASTVNHDSHEEKTAIFKNIDKISCQKTLRGHERIVCCLSHFEKEGTKYLLSASKDKTMNFWDLSDFDNMKVSKTISTSSYTFSATIFNMNGHYFLASGGYGSKHIEVWNLENYEIEYTLKGHTDNIYTLANYGRNQKYFIVSGSYDCTIKLWDTSSKVCVFTFTGHNDIVRSLDIYETNGKHFLASGSEDSSIKLWDLDDKSLIRTLDHHIDCVRSIKVFYKEEKPYLASGSCDKTIIIWNLNNYQIEATMKGGNNIETLTLIHMGKPYLVSGSFNEIIKYWDLEKYTPLKSFNVLSSTSCFTPFNIIDDSYLFLGHKDGRITVWGA